MNDRINPTPISETASRSHPRFQAVYLVIAIVAVLVVAGLAVWKLHTALNASAHKYARKWICSVSASLVGYSEFRGHLPYPVVRQEPAGQSKDAGPPDGMERLLYSWRVEIVPYLTGWHGTWDPSQPWDHPANKQLAELSSFYTFDAPRPEGHRQSFPETKLLAITGPGTAFGDGSGRPMALKDTPPATILAVETGSSGIPWSAPGDFDIRTMPRTVCARDGTGISSRNAGGFHVIFADGSVWFLSDKVPFETLNKFFRSADAEKHDRKQLLGPFALHQGF